MKELLSSEEIDTLLELFRAEGGGLDETEEQIVRVAATHPDLLDKDAVDLLQPRAFPTRQREILGRWFAGVDRAFAAAFADRLRLESHCECSVVERHRWAAFRATQREPVEVMVVEFAPLSSRALMIVSSNLLHAAVDRLLGGCGEAMDRDGRLGAAEFTVIEGLIDSLIGKAADALTPIAKVEGRMLERRLDLQMVRCLGQHDSVIVVRYRLDVGEESGELQLILPYSDLEARLEESLVQDEPQVEPGALRDRMEHEIREVPLELDILLGRAELTLGELLGLHRGDVVRLDAPVGTPVEGLVQGCGKLRGEIGPRQGRMMFRVTDPVHGESDDGA